MLMEDDGYVKPASRESRLVMVQLEPSAEKEPRRFKQNQKRDQGQEHEQENQKQAGNAKGTFLTISWKHVAIGKGFMAAHAHDIRLKVRRKRSNIIGK